MTKDYRVIKGIAENTTQDLGIFSETDAVNAIYSVKETDNGRNGNFSVIDTETNETTNFIINCDRCFEVVTDGSQRRHVEV